MSGHSKWATTKRQKAVVDAKKGAIFTKLANVITIAAREKGGDPSTNFMLRMAMEKARSANMPKDNIERAVKRGTGEGGGAAIEELIYEGIGPAKAQFIIKCLTDNKNRTASVIRHLFTKNNGSLGTVGWNFETKGVIAISNFQPARSACLSGRQAGGFPVSDIDEFELETVEAGADDVVRDGEVMIIYTKPENLQKVKGFLDSKGIATDSAEIEYVAKEKAQVAEEDREKIEKFIEELEDDEDVSDYYTNLEI